MFAEECRTARIAAPRLRDVGSKTHLKCTPIKIMICWHCRDARHRRFSGADTNARFYVYPCAGFRCAVFTPKPGFSHFGHEREPKVVFRQRSTTGSPRFQVHWTGPYVDARPGGRAHACNGNSTAMNPYGQTSQC